MKMKYKFTHPPVLHEREERNPEKAFVIFSLYPPPYEYCVIGTAVMLTLSSSNINSFAKSISTKYILLHIKYIVNIL